jgi:hypothetical protein
VPKTVPWAVNAQLWANLKPGLVLERTARLLQACSGFQQRVTSLLPRFDENGTAQAEWTLYVRSLIHEAEGEH